jgi:cytochrome P450
MRASTRKTNLAPGPSRLPIVGNAFTFARDPRLAVIEWARAHGPIVRFHLGPMVVHIVSDPEHVKHVLTTRSGNYGKVPRMGFLSDFLGSSLLTMEGSIWHRRRRLAQPAFSHAHIDVATDVVIRRSLQMADRWHAEHLGGRPFDVSAEMMRLTLGVAGEALFGVDLGKAADQIGRDLPLILNHILWRLNSVVPLPLWLPTPGNRRYHAAVRRLDAIVLGIIRDWRSGRVEPRGLAATLMAARDPETGAGLTEQELRDEVMTLIFAGHETTSSALAWSWWLLAQNPAAAGRVRDELASVLGDRPPTAADLPALRTTANTVKEAMRLMPPSWAIGRMPYEDDDIGGYHIPAGSMVLLAACATHRDPELWENPDAFDPDRFLPERFDGRPRMAYYPFSSGPRVCIGSNFSMMEATLVLAVMLQRFRLELDPMRPVEAEASITLRPKRGLWMTLHSAAQPRRVPVAAPAPAPAPARGCPFHVHPQPQPVA